MNTRNKKTILAFSFALFTHLFAIYLWYATFPHNASLTRYLPYFWIFLCGFLFVKIDGRFYFLKLVILGALIASSTAIANWIAGRLGISVDYGSIELVLPVALLGLPLSILFSLLGGISGVHIRANRDKI